MPEKAHVAFGRTAYYPAVAPSTALAYESLADGLKQTLVLADKAAPCTFQFAVTISGGVLRKTPGDGWAVFAADNDRPVFDLGEIAVWDSAAEPSVCDSATLEVVPQAGGALLTYRVPREWLDDPTRVYPVYVDPTFNDTASQDTYIHSTGNTAAHGGSAYLYSGKNTTTGSNYALLKFELGSIMGAKINSATFSVYCSSLVANTYVYLRRNTGYWSEGWKYSDGLPASDYLANKKLAATGWVDWDVKTTVQQWVDSVGAPYWYGFQLMNPSTDGGNHYKQYYSSEYATTSLRPKLVVDYTLVPDPVAASGTTVASEWFREVDRNGDGVSDTPNDEPGRGRGLVDLTWPQAARATGYNIYAFDGDSYEKVGTVFGGATTSWSSGGAGMFPTDSEIKNWSVGARNAFTRAASPRKMSKETQFNAGGQGENVGVLVGDGKHLYTRGWRTDAGFGGSDAWIRIGSGYGGTTAGQNLGQVGPDFTDKPVMSAFYLDGVIYNGYAETSASVSGVPRDAGAGEERTVGIRFHDEAGLPKPLVDRGAGRDLTGESPHVLLASDGDRIYNVAYGIGGVGGAGYTVREFDRTGLWLGDHVIPMPSEMLDGVLADGEALYLMQWNNTDSAHVTKVRTADWKVANQWPIDQATTGVINGCYDKTTNHFWLGSLTSGTVYKYLGSGLDLRNDPNALYRKSTTQAYLNNLNRPGFSGDSIPWLSQYRWRPARANRDPRTQPAGCRRSARAAGDC